MIERPVRDLHSSKRVPPLFCKVIVDGDKVTLEIKGKDNKKQTISWKDMVYQVAPAFFISKTTRLTRGSIKALPMNRN